jgi:hypothetical protein
MPRATRVLFTFAVACVTLVPAALAHEIDPSHRSPAPPGQIYAHGVLRQTDRQLEAVVEVGADFLSNVQAGQQVWMDVRQGHLFGIVKCVHSPVEVTIAVDTSRTKIKLSRLQPGQAVIAVIQLDPDCTCVPLEIPESE